MLRRHELAVAVQQLARAEHEHRVVQRAAVALVDTDDAVQVVLAARRGQPVDERPGHVDRVRVQALPQLVEAAEARRARGPGIRRIQGHERLGQDGEPRALPGRLGQQADRLVHAGLGVEDHRRRLDRGDADGGHGATLPPGRSLD